MFLDRKLKCSLIRNKYLLNNKSMMNSTLLLLTYLATASTALAFQPSGARKMSFADVRKSKISDLDPVSHIDLDHAHECAKNFGQCEVGEMEDTLRALKTERIQHEALGFILDPEDELDHRLLEEDLTLQLALLRDEMCTAPLYKVENPEVKPSHDNVVAVIANPEYYHHDHTFRDYVEQGEELFLMPNGVADAFAFGLSLAILAAAPYLMTSN